MGVKIRFIVIGAVAFFGILIGMQMILPFPYGMAVGLLVSFLVLGIFILEATKDSSKHMSSSIMEKNDEAMSTIYCRKCGKKITSSNKYCTECGTAIS